MPPDIDLSELPTTYTINIKELDVFDVRATIAGDPAFPVKTVMTGDKQNPIATHMTGDADNPIATLITGDESKPVTTLMTGDSSKPIATTVDLLNLPHLSLEDIKDLMTPKIRVRMPNYEQICFKVFGIDIFSLCLSGEFQAITEGYEPNHYEKCDIDCPDLDVRPFPKTETHTGADT